MTKKIDMVKTMLDIIFAAGKPVKIDDLSAQLGVNRRTVQNYIYFAQKEGVNIESVPGRLGGVRVGR